jgi:hypothetical protein
VNDVSRECLATVVLAQYSLEVTLLPQPLMLRSRVSSSRALLSHLREPPEIRFGTKSFDEKVRVIRRHTVGENREPLERRCTSKLRQGLLCDILRQE